MTYFGFLLLFLVVPIGLLLALAWRDGRQGKRRPAAMRGWPVGAGIVLHVVVAVLYTTPWDNYLVATRVWWYDPALVTGLTLGWVPIEEYTFFVLQPILAGLWLWALLRNFRNPGFPEARAGGRSGYLKTGFLGRAGARGRGSYLKTGFLLGALWLAAAAILALGWQPGTYLALELVWALPPIGLQLLFGADILWRHRRLLLLAIVPVTLYLSAADALAIGWGTWTISPAQSLNIYLGGVLPLEELLFFLLTNTLVTFGLTLFWAEESQARLRALRRRLPFLSGVLAVESNQSYMRSVQRTLQDATHAGEEAQV